MPSLHAAQRYNGARSSITQGRGNDISEFRGRAQLTGGRRTISPLAGGVAEIDTNEDTENHHRHE